MGELFINIGAGPVGLFEALQHKKRDPMADIVLYEGRETYLRTNQLSIHRNSLTEGAIQVGDALELETIRRLNDAHETPGQSAPKRGLRKVTRLPANVFEQIFEDEAIGRGIKIVYEQVGSIQQLTRQHPGCRYIVAADGTHSAIRKQLLGPDDEALERRPIQTSIDVQYMVQGQAQYTQVPTYNLAHYMVAETIGKEENGFSRVGLRFLVDQDTFDSFPDTRVPLKWNEIPKNFLHHVAGFMYVRGKYTDEPHVSIDTVKATRVNLSCYAAKQFAIRHTAETGDETAVFLVGNAALAVPWYKSVNIGLRTASRLAEVLANPTLDFNRKIDAYEALRPAIVAKSFKAATDKLRVVTFYRHTVRPRLQVAGVGAVVVPLAILTAPITVPVGLAGYAWWKYYKWRHPEARAM